MLNTVKCFTEVHICDKSGDPQIYFGTDVVSKLCYGMYSGVFFPETMLNRVQNVISFKMCRQLGIY